MLLVNLKEKTENGSQTGWEDLLNGHGLHVNSRATTFSGGSDGSGNVQCMTSAITSAAQEGLLLFFTCQIIKEDITLILYTLLQKTEETGELSSLYKASITLI